MTQFYVFDVGHGAGMGLVSQKRDIFVIDAGSGGPKNFSPLDFLGYFGKKAPEILAIQNFDQDHISGILHFNKPESLYRNKSTKSDEVRSLKRQQDPNAPTPELTHALNLHDSYVYPVASGKAAPDRFPDIKFKFYKNDWDRFKDTNNTSFCIFFQYMGVVFFLPGDLESAGLDTLVQTSETFKQQLLATDILIAPHHGRSTGYSSAAFSGCEFRCVVISDGRVQYATQRASQFRHHVPNGLRFPGGKRRVLSTRKDSMITFFPTPDNRLAVQLDNGNQAYVT